MQSCGVSINQNKIKSFKEAIESDPISAYGGIVSCNFKINISLAKEINKIYFEIIMAKGFDKKSLNLLKKKKNLRIINTSKFNDKSKLNFISKYNSILIQNSDNNNLTKKDFTVVSKRKPNNETLTNLFLHLMFAEMSNQMQ